MMGVLQNIVERKNLILWGDFDEEDLASIREQLPTGGVYLHLVADSVSRANRLIRIVSGHR